jgi:hypothetical protein
LLKQAEDGILDLNNAAETLEVWIFFFFLMKLHFSSSFGHKLIRGF